MIECVIMVLVVTIVAVIVLYVLEQAMASIIPLPPPIWHLIRLLVGLIVLLYALRCFGIFTGRGPVF